METIIETMKEALTKCRSRIEDQMMEHYINKEEFLKRENLIDAIESICQLINKTFYILYNHLMDYPNWIAIAYAKYDSDKRTNGIDDMESFADAVLSSLLTTYMNKHVVWNKTNAIVVGQQDGLLKIRLLDPDQSYGMIELASLDEIEVK